MTFYESIANQGMQPLAVRLFIETSGKNIMCSVLRLGSKVCN